MLTLHATRERVSVPLDTDAILAVLADSRNARGNSLSPKLKDKHIQRLRALRERLQALKQLRTWPAPGRTGDDDDEKRGGGSLRGSGTRDAGGVQDEGGIDKTGNVSSEGAEDAYRQSALINGATERNDEFFAPREEPREDAADGRADATTDGEKEEHAVAVWPGSLSHAGASVGNGVPVVEPSGSVEQGGCLETGVDAVRSVGRARDPALNNAEDSGEARPTSKSNHTYSSSNNSNNHQDSPNDFGDRPSGEDTKSNDRRDLDARSSGNQETSRLRHREGASVPSSAASASIDDNSSDLNDNVLPTKEGGSVHALGAASSTKNARNKTEEASSPGVRREERRVNPDSFESARFDNDQLRAGGSNKITSNEETLGVVRGATHGSNDPSRSHGESGSDMDATEYASNDGAAATAAGRDLGNSGSLTNRDGREGADLAGDRNYVAASGADNRSVGGIQNLNSGKEAVIGGNSKASVDGSSEGAGGVAGQSTDKLPSTDRSNVIVGGAVREGGTATDATQGSGSIGTRKRERDAAGAVQRRRKEDNDGDGANGEAPMERGNTSNNSNTQGARRAETDGVPTHHQARLNSCGGGDALPDGETLDAGQNSIPGSRIGVGRNGDSTAADCDGRETSADIEYAPVHGNLDSDEPVGPENDRQSPSAGSDRGAYRTGGNERGGATAVAAASLATNREGDHVTDGVFSHDGGRDEESVHVPDGGGMSRWSLRTPSSQSGVLDANRDEGSLDGELNSTTSISSGEEWRLSSSQTEDGGEISVGGVEEQEGRGGSKGVRGGGQGRRVRASGGSDTGRKSDALSSADNKGHPSRRQVNA